MLSCIHDYRNETSLTSSKNLIIQVAEDNYSLQENFQKMIL